MTQMLYARNKKITEHIEYVALAENKAVEDIREAVAQGKIAIPANTHHSLQKPMGVGGGLTIKVNANIGTSPDRYDIEFELAKLRVAEEAGADTIMDLSTGGDIDFIRKQILANCTVPLGTVPIYQAVCELVRDGGKLRELTGDAIFRVIEKQAIDGVDFMTVHCGITRESLRHLEQQGRILGIVSRGGSFLARWMTETGNENPLYARYDELLEIARTHDVTLSLGDGLRPGCIADATDRGQIQELIILGELTKRAWEAGVQVMIEGPGHVPLHHIALNMQLQKSLCNGAPFYVLGPLVTDIAPGYDHITSAIGGALAAISGADFLCYVTSAEHLRLPNIEDVREGVITARIAAHAADIARGNSVAIERNKTMAKARRDMDWTTQMQLAIDPEKALRMRAELPPADSQVCTMCGKYCAIKGFE